MRIHHPPFVIPVTAVRAGAGLSAGVYSVKALQVLLSPGPPELGADDKGVVEGFGVSFNLPTEDFVRRPHPFNGTTMRRTTERRVGNLTRVCLPVASSGDSI